MISSIIVWLKDHHWMHSWSKWQEKTYVMTYFCHNPPLELNESFQDRQCSVCGKKESVKI